MGCSLPPTSRAKLGGQIKCGGGVGGRSRLRASPDEGNALGNVLIDRELHVIRGDEEDHY
jgi:hypothetical protein